MELIGPTSQSFISQRLKLNYLDWGGRGKPPLVLVHGGRDHARSWDWTAEALREDYHVIAMDHRGHGDSDWVSDGVYSRAGGVLTAVSELVAPGGVPFALDRSALRLTVLGGARAVEIDGCPAP